MGGVVAGSKRRLDAGAAVPVDARRHRVAARVVPDPEYDRLSFTGKGTAQPAVRAVYLKLSKAGREAKQCGPVVDCPEDRNPYGRAQLASASLPFRAPRPARRARRPPRGGTPLLRPGSSSTRACQAKRSRCPGSATRWELSTGASAEMIRRWSTNSSVLATASSSLPSPTFVHIAPWSGVPLMVRTRSSTPPMSTKLGDGPRPSRSLARAPCQSHSWPELDTKDAIRPPRPSSLRALSTTGPQSPARAAALMPASCGDHHSANEPSRWVQRGLRQRWPISAARRTAASSMSIPSPGATSGAA